MSGKNLEKMFSAPTPTDDDQDFFEMMAEALYDVLTMKTIMIMIYYGNNDDDDALRLWWWRFQLTKNCEGNDGRSLLANTIVGDTEVSAGVLATNLNYGANDCDGDGDGDDNYDHDANDGDGDNDDDHDHDYCKHLV